MEERRPLSPRARFLVASFMLVALALAAASSLVVAHEARERARERATRESLLTARAYWRLVAELVAENYSVDGAPQYDPSDVRDAWGHFVVCRWPSRTRPPDYDVYSFGRNGIDEQGSGDDIVLRPPE